MSQSLFRGSGVALVTPMTPDGIDFPALEQLIEWHIASSTDALILCATTGEGATLTYAERAEIIERSVRQVNGRVPVIVGTGSNNTASAIALSREACAAGADGVLVVTPYYNKATQRGLVRHFTAVADAVDRPLIVYNVPSRTGVSCTAETYAVLAQHPNIVGVKEASGSFALIQETLNLCGDGFSVWSGNDEDTAAVCALGGAGDLRRGKHRSARNAQAGGAVPCRPHFGGRMRTASPCSAHPGALLRGQSHSDQDRDGAHGTVQRSSPSAVVRNERRKPRAALRRNERLRRERMKLHAQAPHHKNAQRPVREAFVHPFRLPRRGEERAHIYFCHAFA